MSNSSAEELSFEQALSSLEQVVRDLEDGQLPLEDALARYEAGIGLLKRCYLQLQNAEQKILQLTGVGPDGQPALELFDHSATAAASPALRAKRVTKSGGADS
jgi:exodeoxyribonuclease VII small subunit